MLILEGLENDQQKSLNLTLWNATGVKNKTIELPKFLNDYNTDIAIIIWLAPTDIFTLINYNVYRKDGPPTIASNPIGEVHIATHKDTPVADIQQSTSIA